MKDLFISMGDRVNVRNFTDGSFAYRSVSASEVQELAQETRSGGGHVRAYFDLGPVPSEKKMREFRELVAAFEKMTGVQLSSDDFFTSEAESSSGDRMPDFNFTPTVTDAMNMLAVEYFFSLSEGAESLKDGLSVADDTMNFHFFEYMDQ